MTLIPQIKFYADDITDVVQIEVMLKTLPSGSVIYSLDDVLSCILLADDTEYPLKASKDNEHWYKCVHYTKLQLVQTIKLKVVLPSKEIVFHEGPMHWEHLESQE